MFAIIATVTLMVVGLIGYIISINAIENNNEGLAGIAIGLAVTGILAAGFIGSHHGSNQDAKRESTLEATYQVEVIKTTDGGFIATDEQTGKTLECKITKDDSIVVCDGVVRTPRK